MIALTTFPVGFCIGTVEVAIPAFSQEEGSAALAGILLAVWSAASGIGGLVFGARRPSRSLAETFLVIAVVFPLACLPLAGASSPVVMGALIALAGLPDRPADLEPQRAGGPAGARVAPPPSRSPGCSPPCSPARPPARRRGGALAESESWRGRDPGGSARWPRWERCWRGAAALAAPAGQRLSRRPRRSGVFRAGERAEQLIALWLDPQVDVDGAGTPALEHRSRPTRQVDRRAGTGVSGETLGQCANALRVSPLSHARPPVCS